MTSAFRVKLVTGYYQTKLPWADTTDPEWLTKRQAHAKDQLHLEVEFKHDLFEELGLVPGTEVDVLYNMAWELARCSMMMGHVPIFLNMKRLLLLQELERFLR